MPVGTVKIPRPPNAFILYRNNTLKTLRLMHDRPIPGTVVSIVAGRAWALEPDENKMVFRRMADVAKKEHQLKYPDYCFKPKKAKKAAAGAKRTRTRNRIATNAAKNARKGRKATTIYHEPPISSRSSPFASTPSWSSMSSFASTSSLSPSPIPTPPPTAPVAPIGLSGFSHASQGPLKQAWTHGLASLNQLSPDDRSELMRRTQLLYGPASSMGHGLTSVYGETQHGMLPNYHYQAYDGFMAPQGFPPSTFPHGTLPPMGTFQPGMGNLGLSDMQHPGWTQPSDVDFGFNPFASPIPQDERACYFPDAGSLTPAPDGAEPWAAPWSSNNDCATEYATSVTESPAQASMSMPDLLDMSSVRPISPSNGMHEPQSCTSSAAQAASIDSAPAASLDAEVEEFLLSINASFEPSYTASSSFFGLSPADVSEEDSSQTLYPSHLWTQGLDDWNMDGAAA